MASLHCKNQKDAQMTRVWDFRSGRSVSGIASLHRSLVASARAPKSSIAAANDIPGTKNVIAVDRLEKVLAAHGWDINEPRNFLRVFRPERNRRGSLRSLSCARPRPRRCARALARTSATYSTPRAAASFATVRATRSSRARSSTSTTTRRERNTCSRVRCASRACSGSRACQPTRALRQCKRYTIIPEWNACTAGTTRLIDYYASIHRS